MVGSCHRFRYNERRAPGSSFNAAIEISQLLLAASDPKYLSSIALEILRNGMKERVTRMRIGPHPFLLYTS
jgi:hypothetical protein